METTAVLEGLNAAQEAAVRCVNGPVLIVAGAGSGKTRVLTSRIAYMIAQGADPSRILALTFTKKAANEMKERIAAMVGERNARRIWMGTFHSVFIRFLRGYAESLGFPTDFTIYDTSDSLSLIKTIVKDMGLDDKSAYKPKDVLARISMAKNNLVMPGAYRQDRETMEADIRRHIPRLVDIYSEYMVRCRKSGVMDFDDILVYMNVLFRDNKEALDEISGRFDHILVDEYQDTNRSQYLILRKLAGRHRNICVVGDDSQSIYAFRGAQIENIFNFTRDYPEAALYRLEQNYRSTQVIVEAANSLIEKNTDRIKKTCFSKGDRGELIRIIDGYTPDEEARLIASSIKGRISSDAAAYRDFAILYRTNSQSRALEQELRTANIPYQIFSGKSFFERSEVKDMMAYFKLVVNNNDDESFKRVVNKPARAIGDMTLAAVIAAAKAEGCSLFRAASGDRLSEYGLKSGAVAKLQAFCSMISSLSARAAREDAFEVARAIAAESGMMQMFSSDLSVEGQARLGNVEELLNNVKQVVEEKHYADMEDMLAESDRVEISETDLPVVLLSDYLENISLLSSIDMDGDENSEDATNKVALMTVHSSKGLEFPYVYVSGMEEDLFPAGNSMILPQELQEERRLFYVAITRAMKVLTITFSKTRMKNGQTDYHAPSRFLREIDPAYFKNPLSTPFVVDDDAEAPSPFGSFRSQGRPVYGQGRPAYGQSRPAYGQGLSSYAQPRQSGESSARPSVPSRGASPASPARRPAQRLPNLPPPPSKADFEPSPVSELRVGQRVEHNRFGFGTLREISGNAADMVAVVDFEKFGEKKLILKYAKLRIIF